MMPVKLAKLKNAEIAHNKPWLLPEDIAAVSASLATGWLAPGPEVAAMEKEFSRLHGGIAACAVSSGTAALFLALKGAGVGAGDSVAVPTYVCAAVLNAVVACDATPVLVDINADDFNIDPRCLAGAANKLKAVVAVHTYGAPADVGALRRHADTVIEDCCQSLGGTANDGGALGLDGDAAIASFYATKLVTGGHGGVVYGAFESIVSRARDYINFDGRDEWQPRFNFQMTDFQAALVRAQLSRLAMIKERRRRLAGEYRTVLPAGYAAQAGLDAVGAMPYRFVLRSPDKAARDRLRDHFSAAAIQTIVPLERKELLHRYLKQQPERFPNAERVVDTTLSIPLYPAMTDIEAERVVNALANAPAL